jgi:hypothetical protein
MQEEAVFSRRWHVTRGQWGKMDDKSCVWMEEEAVFSRI